MDFTAELAAFQGALISADNVHQFSKITSKGGNEDKIKFVILSIKRFLEAEKYTDTNGLINTMIPNTRKFAMYIVLNADLKVLDDLMDISEIEPLIWSIPTVPKYLMCEMMWQLHFEIFVYEMISKCWPQLGIEVAQAFLDNFKYMNPTDCLNKLYKLSAACYALLCRINYFKLEESLHGTITTLIEILQKFLKYYIHPPNKHKLDILSHDELYKYKGKRFRNILNLVYDCATMFTQTSNPSSDDLIYKVTYSTDCLQNTEYKVCESPCEVVLECINNSNTFLLDIFKDIVMDVSIDLFCAWSEYEEDGKSMQQVIGELCGKVQSLLKSISSMSEHPVVVMIDLMARKPTDINEIINTTDIATILEKINSNNEESQLWIHALVYKEHLFEHVELVHAVKDNLSVFDNEECFKLYNKFKIIADDSFTDRELLVYTKIKLFDGCNVLGKHEILKEHFRDKILVNIMTNEDFDVQLNIMFNKFIADVDVDFTYVLTLFYQNPQKVYTKIFGLATQNPKLIDPMLKVIKILKDYTEYFYNTEMEPCIISVMKCIINTYLQVDQSCNILKFICDLKSDKIISSSQLLMLVVMPSIHEALIKKDLVKMHIQVQLLIDAYTVDELLSYRAPMLVMMGQIMATVRPRTLETFQAHALKTLQIVIKFQKSIIDTYRQIIPVTDGSWLKQKVRELKLHPLNFYYFKSLWNADSKSFFESVTDSRIHKGACLKTLSSQLAQFLVPWATLEEWCVAWDNFIDSEIKALDALRIYNGAIDILIHKVNSLRTVNTLACLYYCFGNLIHIIRYKYLREPLTNLQVNACCILLAHNLKSSNDADVVDIESVTMPLFAYLAERKNDYTVNVPNYFVNTSFLNTINKFFPTDNSDNMES